MIHDGMPKDPIQGQGHGQGDPKVARMADFKRYLLCRYARRPIKTISKF